jgi:hypothetical protein
MTPRRLFVSVALAFGLAAAPLLYGQTAEHLVTTTLLPTESGDAINPNGFLIQEKEPKTAALQFDLSGLPPGLLEADLRRCTLRIVASEVAANPGPNTGAKDVIVRGAVPSNAGFVVSLSRLVANKDRANVQPIAVQANPLLCAAIYKTYVKADKNKDFSITLSTETYKASSMFYSSKSAGNEFSRIPRLVIEYKSPPVSFLDSLSWEQSQHDPEHTGRSSWKPFTAPFGFAKERVSLPPIGSGPGGEADTVADYPLIYQGNLYILYKTATDNYLVGLDFTGRHKRWEAKIGAGTVADSPVIGPGGLLYLYIALQRPNAPDQKTIAAYDLNRGGAKVGAYELSERAGSPDLTVGDDGSVFLALQESNVHYMLAFTSKLVPFIRSTSYPKISTITTSASGDRIFAQTPKGAAILDIANPKEHPVLPFAGAAEYHVPVAGPAGGVMLFSAFNGNNAGRVWSYAETEKWKTPPGGTSTSQPVLGGNGRLYFVQDGELQGYLYTDGAKLVNHTDKACSVTSNLVIDGSDNVYFWCTKLLQSYKSDRTPLVQSAVLDGPQKDLRFELAPDGTLWTNNKKDNALYALTPIYAPSTPNLTVTRDDIRTHTAYRTTGNLAVAENVKVGSKATEPPMEVLFQAKGSISFARGFSVEKGASILCRTGF